MKGFGWDFYQRSFGETGLRNLFYPSISKRVLAIEGERACKAPAVIPMSGIEGSEENQRQVMSSVSELLGFKWRVRFYLISGESGRHIVVKVLRTVASRTLPES